jgi:uncharacterized NAD(P)/FAD-binding protein YdhS
MKSVAIVGAGFSGSLLAIHLMRESVDLQVTLIEKRGRFGPGLAYSTNNDAHLLNVTVGKMSAFAAEPAHFFSWLRDTKYGALPHLTSESFVPRRLYGRYLEHLLEHEADSHHGRFKSVRGEVVGIRPGHGRAVVNLYDGSRIDADRVVLALGNFPPADPEVENQELYSTRYYRRDPWHPGALRNLDTDVPVLLIGSGLTMVDIVMSLLAQEHTGKIHSISRHGLTPRHHAQSLPLKPPELDRHSITTRALLRRVRDSIEEAPDETSGWRSIVDALRPITQELWRKASPLERLRFYRHLRPWWDVHRHRIPPAIAERIERAIQAGQLVFHTGPIQGYELNRRGVVVNLRAAARDEFSRIEVARVINCSGPATDYQRISDPLVTQLMREGIVRPDPLRLGLDIADDLRVIGSDGEASELVYAMGPPTKCALWEITAVPDLRTQAESLARTIASKLSAENAAVLPGEFCAS